MKKWYCCALVLFFCVPMIVGCGGSGDTVETTAEHHELAQWVNENPEPDEVDPDAQ